MVISAITGAAGVQAQQSIGNADNKLRTAIANIVSGKRSDDIAKVSIASQLQAVTSELRQASSNLALGASLAQVAEGGVSQIQSALQQLQNIAAQSQSPVLNDDNRKQLNEQFKQTLASIDQLAKSTSFNGKNLLDGSLTGNNALSLDSLLGSKEANLGSSLSVDNLSSASLLGSVNVLSADSAGQAITAIASALNQVTATRTNIGAFQQSVNFAGANVDSAIANQEAATAHLTDADLGLESNNNSLADVARNASIALAAQGNRLAPQLLQLVG